MVPSRERLLKGFVFDPSKIDWDYYRRKFPQGNDASVYIMERSIQMREHMEMKKTEIKQKHLIRRIDKILKN